jgi:hypothetical protein
MKFLGFEFEQFSKPFLVKMTFLEQTHEFKIHKPSSYSGVFNYHYYRELRMTVNKFNFTKLHRGKNDKVSKPIKNIDGLCNGQ